MLLMRILCAVFVVISFIVAITPNAILTLMSFSWGTYPVLLLLLFCMDYTGKVLLKRCLGRNYFISLLCRWSCNIGMNAKLAPNIGAVAMLVSLASCTHCELPYI